MNNKTQKKGTFLKNVALLCIGMVLGLSNASAQEVSFGGGYPHDLKLKVEQIAIQKGYGAFGGSTAAAFVQSDGGSGSGSNWNVGTEHLPTLQKVCQILGYRTYVRSTCRDFERSSRYPNGKCNFHSPDTDDMIRFNTATNSFRPEHANPQYGKTFVASITCKDPITACSDGIDNDGDGKKDLADPGCSGPDDNDETDKPSCSDGRDNDGDGKVDLADPGCDGPNDNDETDKPACNDGRDNDGDGRVDLNDPGCENPWDNDETDKPRCSDGLDNDGDGRTDLSDPGCLNPQDNDETDPRKPQCSDGVDNDSDGATDYPADFSCSSPNDDDETNPKSQCQDGIDNDGDGRTDLNDSGCSNPQDNDESGDTNPADKLTAVLECVDKLAENSFVAHFGYKNDNAFVANVNVGTENTFVQAPAGRGQPTFFQVGRVANVFTVNFNGQALQWLLGKTTATASSSSTLCATPSPAPECIDTDIFKTLISMDTGARLELNAIKKALKTLQKLNPKEKTFAAKTLAQATSDYQNAWSTTWSIPQQITSCTNASQCAKVDNLPTVNTYNGYSANLVTLANQVSAKLNKVKNAAGKKAAAKLTKDVNALNAENLKNSSSVPRFDEQC